jgi:uncharacterized SAM-binding protein YcdF (DUF218 family)
MSDLAQAIEGRRSRAWLRLRSLYRTCFTLAGLTAFAFVIGFLLFVDHVAGLQTPNDFPPADGIVVLTGGASRMETGLELLKAGKAKRLLISGVNPVARLVDIRKATGADTRLFNCCVDIDRVALNTIGNAQESAKWALAHTFASIIVVTNNYHMPRSLLEMRRILPNAELKAYPVVNTPLTGVAWIKDRDALRVLTTEYVKYVAALFRTVLPAEAEASYNQLAAVARSR